MNIDERLEALTQSIELLVSMHNEHERQFAEHKRLVTAIESIAETSRQLRENDRLLTQMLAGMRDEQQQDRQQCRDAIMRLPVIAEAHQDTLDDHEKWLGGRTP